MRLLYTWLCGKHRKSLLVVLYIPRICMRNALRLADTGASIVYLFAEPDLTSAVGRRARLCVNIAAFNALLCHFLAPFVRRLKKRHYSPYRNRRTRTCHARSTPLAVTSSPDSVIQIAPSGRQAKKWHSSHLIGHERSLLRSVARAPGIWRYSQTKRKSAGNSECESGT